MLKKLMFKTLTKRWNRANLKKQINRPSKRLKFLPKTKMRKRKKKKKMIAMENK